jgi:hypothetical protein
MAFSVADFGFWRMAGVALLFEIAHALLESHWPDIRGSRLGPRPPAAAIFMFVEAFAMLVVVMAAIGTMSRMLKLPEHSAAGVFAVIGTVLVEGGLFFVLWQH